MAQSSPAAGAGGQREGELARPEDGGDWESLCETLWLLQIDVGWDSPQPRPAGSERWCSRNVLRKQRHWERIVMAKKKKRKQEKERRKAKHVEDKGAAHHQSKRVLKATARERLLAAKEAAPRLCIDLSMSSRMTKKETSRLAAQIRRLYGSNKKAGKPFWICLTGFVTGSPIYQECVRMNDGFSGYLMDTTPDSYLDLFPVERIVYLSPDSENAVWVFSPPRAVASGSLQTQAAAPVTAISQRRGALRGLAHAGPAGTGRAAGPEHALRPLAGLARLRSAPFLALRDVDPHKVYVLGGLVDESIQKEQSLQQAQGHALQTARLPIAEYMVRNANARNYHSETLAINQVCDALVTYYATRSWPEALRAAVPPGKGYVLREPAT